MTVKRGKLVVHSVSVPRMKDKGKECRQRLKAKFLKKKLPYIILIQSAVRRFFVKRKLETSRESKRKDVVQKDQKRVDAVLTSDELYVLWLMGG